MSGAWRKAGTGLFVLFALAATGALLVLTEARVPLARVSALIRKRAGWRPVGVDASEALREDDGSPQPPDRGGDTGAGAPDLVLEGSRYERDPSGTWVVTGTVANRSSMMLSSAEVVVNFYDDDGVQVGSSMSLMNNLAPGARWEFKLFAPSAGAATFDIARITGFTHGWSAGPDAEGRARRA